ncbi:MAG: RdgB/HAM1 family non-canonical purine NTP pyrophosphatase [Nonlabens sp.]
MKIIFATHNLNKLKEVNSLLPSHITLTSLDELGLKDEILETADTIAGNAIQKVEYITARYDMPVIADDTGLLVHALNNEPGVHTARYAGPDRNNEKNIDLLLQNLQGLDDRSARFTTVFALSIDGCQHVFEGICEGTILESRRGKLGFGYDSIFKPDDSNLSFGEMTMVEKNTYSHRAKALSKLVEYLSI